MKSAPTLPLAVCLLALDGDRALAVCRRHDLSQWGMPGGKVDPGETCLEALLRECREEVGLEIRPDDVLPIYEGECKGEVSYQVVTYLYKPKVPALETLRAEDGLSVAMKSLADLLAPETSPFAEYNQGVMRVYDALFRRRKRNGLAPTRASTVY